MPPIERGIPLPARLRPDRSRYQWADMVPGDSILYPKDEGTKARRALSMYLARHRDVGRFTSRAFPDGSIRIWRIE